MAKKLLCVIGQLGNGGSEKQLYLFLKHQKKYNAAVFVTGKDAGVWSERIRGELRCEIYFTGNVSKLSKISQYRGFLRNFKPDTVFSWSFFTNMLVYFSSSIRFIGSLRQQFSDENAASWSTRLCLSKKMDNLVVNSSYIKTELLEKGYPEEKIKVVLNIFEDVSLNSGMLKSEMRNKLLSDFSIRKDAIIVMGIGRNSSVKNFGFFLDVIKEAQKVIPQIHGLLIGSGGEAVRKRIIMENLQHCMTIPGEIPDANNYLHGTDVFFLSSKKEGLPNVLIEALSSGCLCLATDVSGVRDIFKKIPEEFSSKMILKDFSLENAVCQLLELIENKKLREKCSLFSDTVQDLFAPECILKEFEKIL